MLTASPTTASCYLLIYYATYSLHSILPMIPTCPRHTAHIWPYCSSHWWLNKMGHCYWRGKLANLTNMIWTLDLINFWHQDAGPVNAQVELPWWQWSAVLLGRLHLQKQESCSGLQDDDHYLTHKHITKCSYLFPTHCTICQLWDTKFKIGPNHTFMRKVTLLKYLHFPFYQFSRYHDAIFPSLY